MIIVKETSEVMLCREGAFWIEADISTDEFWWRSGSPVAGLDGSPGYWVVGGPSHMVEGDPVAEMARFKADPLAWWLAQRL